MRKKKIAIFGSGKFGRIFYKALEGKIDFFIDDFSCNTVVEGKEVLAPKDADKTSRVFVSVFENSEGIKLRLKKIGFEEVFSFRESVKLIPNILYVLADQEYLWMTKDKNRMINVSALEKVKTFLKDKKSVDLIDNLIKFRSTLDPIYYPEPECGEYFPKDVPILDGIDVLNFVDCGAYTGDTAKKIFEQKNNVNSIVLFEPDRDNFQMLEKTIDSLKLKHKNTSFFLYPCGVFSHTTYIGFMKEQASSSSHIEINKNLNEILVCALDDVIKNFNVNLIKMDIEGAEKAALEGASKIIQAYKPNLAICLYHRPEDLWELPITIHNIEPSYEMYIRVHGDLCLSTILYCISRNK